jgi:esterase/lipase superfamily enzyme
VKSESRLHSSIALGHDMEYRIYRPDSGVAGQPVVAFPSMNGRVWDWEGWGMIEAIAPLIEAGRVTLYAADGIDWQSWTNAEAPVEQRALRHDAYDRYLIEDLLPVVRAEAGRDTVWAIGCSMGAYHATNLFFRHPDLVDAVIAISGVFQPSRWIGEYVDEAVVRNSPLYALPRLDESASLERYRHARLVFCVGQGAWEDEMVADARALEKVLAAKEIPATFDYWGHDVNHDWPWWRRMLSHHLERLLG